MTRPNHANDPDGFFANDALVPDPVFMGVRAVVHTGPIGAIMRWIDRKIEAREERRYGLPPGFAASSSSEQSTTPDFVHLVAAAEQDAAA